MLEDGVLLLLALLLQLCLLGSILLGIRRELTWINM